MLADQYIRSPIFYMGNKLRLLPKIEPLFPKDINTFYDLFGGSGCVSMNVAANKVVYNELNENIVDLFKMFIESDADTIISKIESFIKEFDLNTEGTDVRQNISDIEETRKLYSDHYFKFREAYNKNQSDIYMLYTLTFYSFSNLIRFNSNNEFNMPYGNRCYTKEHEWIIKNWCDLVHHRNIEVSNRDAFEILESAEFNKDDFCYCDPPYSQTMAIYNEQRAFGGWSVEDDYRLFGYLEKLDSLGVHWGMSNVFKNKDFTNQHLMDWCEHKGWNVRHLDFTYSSLGKGNANSDEVYIFNYDTDVPELGQFHLF